MTDPELPAVSEAAMVSEVAKRVLDELDIAPGVRTLTDLSEWSKGLKTRLLALVEDSAADLRNGRDVELGGLVPSPTDAMPLLVKYAEAKRVMDECSAAFRAASAHLLLEAGVELEVAGRENTRTGRKQLRVMDPLGDGCDFVVDPKLDTELVWDDFDSFVGLIADEALRKFKEPDAQSRAVAIEAITEVLRYMSPPKWKVTALTALSKVYRERKDIARAGVLERAYHQVKNVLVGEYTFGRQWKDGRKTSV